MIAGLVPLSLAIILATQLVISEVVATRWVSWSVAGVVALVILVLWWIVPTRRHARHRGFDD
ncbi:hypothetical protein BH20CHL3_BH20CHL3_05440 [soil metagenome]